MSTIVFIKRSFILTQTADLGHVHTILENSSCRHEKLSYTVWTATTQGGTSGSHT